MAGDKKNSGVYICWDRMGMVGDMWGLLVQTYFTAIYLSEEIWHCLSHDTCLFRAVYFQLFHRSVDGDADAAVEARIRIGWNRQIGVLDSKNVM